MTRIDFYFNVPNMFRQVAELAEAALVRQRRLFIYTPDADATAQLEATLWSYKPTGFLPHCRSCHALASETPIVLDWIPAEAIHDDILINMTTTQPAFFSRFRGLIELVGLDESDRAKARHRYRFYRDRGYEIRNHDLAKG
jgi:DNA polymerase-3 subunit chi